MSLIASAIDYQFFQDVFFKLEEQGIFFDHVLTKYHPNVSNFKFFKNPKIKAVDVSKFFNLVDLIELNKSHELPLDKHIIDFLAPVERDYYILTDRFNYIPRSFRYRKLMFRESVRFWFNYLQAENITFFFASCTPHDLAGYTCYHIAKYLNVPTLQLNQTIINDYIISMYDYRIGEKVPANYLTDYSDEEAISEIPEKLYSRALGKSNVLQFSIKQNASVMSGNVASVQIPNLGKHNSIALNDASHLNLTDYRDKFNLLYLDYKVPNFVRRLIKYYEKKRIERLKSDYQALTIAPDYTQKYIYFATHMQPERTTTPEAGVFEDHYLAVAILAKSLPESWKLYVKEHPAQFHNKHRRLKTIHARNALDYKMLASLKNVQLIRAESSSAELIKNAQIVSTLSGSVGWEALMQSKTCIIFAPAWYSASQSIRIINDVAEGKAAIAELSRKSGAEIHSDVLKYLHYMRDKLHIGNIGDDVYLDAITLPYEEHLNSITKLIANEVKSKS